MSAKFAYYGIYFHILIMNCLNQCGSYVSKLSYIMETLQGIGNVKK